MEQKYSLMSLDVNDIFDYVNIVPSKLFTKIYSTLPDCYVYEPEHQTNVDFSKMDEDTIKKIGDILLPDHEYCTKTVRCKKTRTNGPNYDDLEHDKKTRINGPNYDSDDLYDYDFAYASGGVYVSSKVFFISLSSPLMFVIGVDALECYYQEDQIEFDLWSLFDDIWSNKLPLRRIKSKDAGKIELVTYNDGFETTTSSIQLTNVDIDANYNDDVSKRYKDIEAFLDSSNKKSGVIFFRGIPGTGKTMLIRHIITNIPNEYILMTSSVVSRMGSPDFISFLQEHSSSVFIMEDCEQVIMDKSRNAFTGALSTILNMADGLLSDIFNFKFICTYNGDLGDVDDAMLRKGRCYGDYEFNELSADKVKALCERNNIQMDKYTEMTLADIYNYSVDENSTKSVKSSKKIGF